MEHASTSGDVRHRQNKAFKQRLAYWLKKDFPYEEALRRAELRNQIDGPLKLVSSLENENLPGPKPARTKASADEKLQARKSSEAKTCQEDNLTGRKSSVTKVAQECKARSATLAFPFINLRSGAAEPKDLQSASLALNYSSSPQHLTMNFDQPLPTSNTLSSDAPIAVNASHWRGFGRKCFWLLFASSCLTFLIYGNFSRMNGPLSEVVFKATFGELLLFGAGLMAFKSMADQAQKILMSFAGIGVSLFLTHATITSAHKRASDERDIAERTRASETHVRDSLVKNLSEISPDRIRRAEELREKIAASTVKVDLAQKALQSIPSADSASHDVDLFIRLLAQLSILISLSQFRKPEESS